MIILTLEVKSLSYVGRKMLSVFSRTIISVVSKITVVIAATKMTDKHKSYGTLNTDSMAVTMY